MPCTRSLLCTLLMNTPHRTLPTRANSAVCCRDEPGLPDYRNSFPKRLLNTRTRAHTQHTVLRSRLHQLRSRKRVLNA